MGKCVFNQKWLTDDRFKKWIREFKGDKHSATCTRCNKIIELGKMGEHALTSHMKSKKHLSLSTGQTSCLTFKKSSTMDFNNNNSNNNADFTVPPPPPTESVKIPPPTTGTSTAVGKSEMKMDIFVSRNETLKAEIMWTLHTVTQHCSFKSNDDVTKLFPLMFPDSPIANKFSCGERKSSYLAVFGIAEYLKKKLFKTIRGHYSILFDESLNRSSQSKQMDIHVRYWDEKKNVVTTRYFGSQFLGHASANDMMTHFDEAIIQSDLDIKNMIQIGMDGPNVNWKFYDILTGKLQKDFDSSILNVGSCRLHVMNNSFKAGAVASEWKVDSLLSSIYYLYKDSPARRDDFTKICNGGKMPLKFCNHRWLENVPVAQRTIEIWPTLVKYVEEMETKKTKPTCNSYSVLKQFTKDKLVIAKLEFFKLMASAMQSFLTFYQTDKPVLPMMANDISILLKSLLRRFVKPEVLALCNTLEKLSEIDISNKENLLNYKKVDIGINTDQALRDAGHISDRQILEFRMSARDFLISACKKILTKCPLAYSLVRNLSSLDPRTIYTDSEQCKVNFRKILVTLRNARIVNENCDIISDQYVEFIETTDREIFSNFSKQTDRLDSLFHENMSSPNYEKLFPVVKMLLVMSHGQAVVERGFSINKEVESVNLSNKTLVAQRMICDFVSYCGGVAKVPISNELLSSVASARHRYELYLEEQRKQKMTEEQSRKRKGVLEELEDLKTKKKKLKLDFDSLLSKADKLAEQAEDKGQLALITQSNCLRKRAKDKEEEIKKIDTAINQTVASLKN